VTKLHDEFRVALPVEQASPACRRAIAAIGWNVKEAGLDRIVPKIGVGVTRNPSKVEVRLQESGEQTVVRRNGSILGIGPLQKAQRNAEMNRRRDESEVAERACAGS